MRSQPPSRACAYRARRARTAPPDHPDEGVLMATYDVAGRSAIVTGAGSGIGRAVALLLAANGAAVLVTDINEAGAKAVADEIRAAGGTAASLAGDVTSQEFAEHSVAAASQLG